MFTKEELTFLMYNVNIAIKIYLLGMTDVFLTTYYIENVVRIDKIDLFKQIIRNSKT